MYKFKHKKTGRCCTGAKYTRPALETAPITNGKLGTILIHSRSYVLQVSSIPMYPWPIADADVTLQEALDIAMYYLESTGQAFPFSKTEKACAQIILMAWRAGTKHRIKLANYAVVAVEQKMPPPLESFYPRAG
jgi:hypothetical protein